MLDFIFTMFLMGVSCIVGLFAGIRLAWWWCQEEINEIKKACGIVDAATLAKAENKLRLMTPEEYKLHKDNCRQANERARKIKVI